MPCEQAHLAIAVSTLVIAALSTPPKTRHPVLHRDRHFYREARRDKDFRSLLGQAAS
jgi:hypothetical protein